MKEHALFPVLGLLAVLIIPGELDAKEPVKLTGAKIAAPTTLYTCPMHPQIRWSKADDCPICGMKLAVVKNGKTMPEDQAADHEGMAMDHDATPMDGHDMGMGGMGCGMCMDMMGMGGMTKGAAPATRKAAPSMARGGRNCGC